MTNKTLYDSVEKVHLRLLLENDDYAALLDATQNKHAIEGSLFTNDCMAAQKIRNQAARDGDMPLAQEKLAAIRKALKVVMRRYGMSRKERREPAARA